MFKSGYVSILGKPNTGKSTLLNKLVNEKISIVTFKPQTTRDNILGVLTDKNFQIAFIDTPGILKVKDGLSRYMMNNVKDASLSADIVVYTISDETGADDADFRFINNLKNSGLTVIVLLTKIDSRDKFKTAENLNSLNNVDCEVIPVSSHKNINIDTLIKVITDNLPEGEKLFDEDFITDKSLKFMCAEILREKLMLSLDKEIPYGLSIDITSFKEEKNITKLSADIICEKKNHKAIIIGKGGLRLKNIASLARADMEKLIGGKVMLEVYVKAKENWRADNKLLQENGYGKNI